MTLALIALAATLVAVGALFVGSRRTGVVPMPSSRSLRRVIVDVLRDYKGMHTVTDLGSGWGGLTRRIARSLNHHKVVAVEHSRIPLLVSRLASGMGVLGNIEHRRSDIFSLPLSEGNAYVCYLSGPSMKKLRRRFEEDLPTGGVLISAAFAVPGWTPTRVEYARDLFRSPVYVYEF